MPGTHQAREAAVLAGVPTQLLIGGVWRDSSSGATLPVEDPATGRTLTHVADATVADGDAALAAAAAAQKSWAATAPRERGEILRRAFETLVARADDLALLMTLEMGKSVAESGRRSCMRRSSSAGSRKRPCASVAGTPPPQTAGRDC